MATAYSSQNQPRRQKHRRAESFRAIRGAPNDISRGKFEPCPGGGSEGGGAATRTRPGAYAAGRPRGLLWRRYIMPISAFPARHRGAPYRLPRNCSPPLSLSLSCSLALSLSLFRNFRINQCASSFRKSSESSAIYLFEPIERPTRRRAGAVASTQALESDDASNGGNEKYLGRSFEKKRKVLYRRNPSILWRILKLPAGDCGAADNKPRACARNEVILKDQNTASSRGERRDARDGEKKLQRVQVDREGEGVALATTTRLSNRSR